MSQNKTVAPGLSPVQGQKHFYSRDDANTPPFEQESKSRPNFTKSGGKPVVGFLYSVSKTSSGEYWPLYLGANVIGSGSHCDVVLSEATVTNEHATIVVRRLKQTEKSSGRTIASISDVRSTNGTLLNGESLAFRAEECKNGDIITFGENYVCYLVLIDAVALGMKEAENFISLEEDEGPNFVDEHEGTVDAGQEPPIFGGVYDGTQGMNGERPNAHGGGTEGV